MSDGAQRGLAARLDLHRAEIALLASSGLALVPGVRLLWGWVCLWFLPGYFFARKVLGLSGFALAVASPVFSIAFASMICLPGIAAMSGPRPVVVLASVVGFSLLCSLRRARWLVRIPGVPLPPWPYLAALALYAVVRGTIACRATPPTGSDDAAYFVGLVRGLSESFPPVNYVAAATTLRQPWGYWMLYALSHVVTGCSIAVTLGIASMLTAVAFMALHYLLVALATNDRVAASLTLPLSLGCFETAWLTALCSSGALSSAHVGYSDQVSYARWLWSAYYDAPALLVGQAVIAFVIAYAKSGDGRALVVAAALLGIMLLFHPVHFFVLGLALALSFAWGLGRRTLTRAHLAFLVVPPPFLLLFWLLFARGMPARAPFEIVPPDWFWSEASVKARALVGYAGLLFLIAPWGAFVRGIARRELLVLMCATPLALWLFTSNFAHNYHWTFDWMLVAGVTLGASAFGGLVRRRRALGSLLVVGFVALSLVGDHREGPVAASAPTAPAELRAGDWIRSHSAGDATFCVGQEDVEMRDAALSFGERRLLFGPGYLLLRTSPVVDVRTWDEANRAILANPCGREIEQWHVDYVGFGPNGDREHEAAWRLAGRLVFVDQGFEIFAPPPRAACPA